MLSKENRVNKKEFSFIIKKGQGFKNGPFLLKIVSNREGKLKLGASVGVKVSKKAVERNRLRRQMQAVLTTQNLNMQKPASGIIIMLYKPNAELSFKEVERSIKGLLQKAEIN